MLEGSSAPEMAVGLPSRPVEAPKSVTNSTSLLGRDFYENHIHPPKFEQPTLTYPQKYEPATIAKHPEGGGVTQTEAPQFSKWDEADINRFIKDLGKEGSLPKNTITTTEVTKNIPKETKKSQGFWAKILEWFRNLFK